MSRQTGTKRKRGTVRTATAGGHPGAGIVAELRRAIAEAEKLGTSRAMMAAAAGMPRAMIYRIADGETLPRIDTAERLANAMGLQLRLVSK